VDGGARYGDADLVADALRLELLPPAVCDIGE
jgi:hypothetical protein